MLCRRWLFIDKWFAWNFGLKGRFDLYSQIAAPAFKGVMTQDSANVIRKQNQANEKRLNRLSHDPKLNQCNSKNVENLSWSSTRMQKYFNHNYGNLYITLRVRYRISFNKVSLLFLVKVRLYRKECLLHLGSNDMAVPLNLMTIRCLQESWSCPH